ncbi:MAG: hypothetical protein NC339_06755 [Muribaculaceae bacterium]|nr:hypothetical protein [Muribaculaceae bacterium]
MKEILAYSETLINWGKQQDLNYLRKFLFSEPNRPLICIGSGGSFSICRLYAILYGTKGSISYAITPYSAYNLSEEAIRNSKILLISNSGHNKDIIAIAKHCSAINPMWTANITSADGPKNDVKNHIVESNSFNFKSEFKDGFISVGSVIGNYVLSIAAFKPNFTATASHPDYAHINFSSAKHFIVLYGGWGEPAAIDLESKLVETGTATCAVSDFRNFCHGRFIFPGNHCGHNKKTEVPDDCIVVLLTTPREASFANKIREVLPERCRIVELSSNSKGAESAIELLISASYLANEVCRQQGIKPMSPANFGGIDKRRPANIPYISDLKASGPLSI